MFANLLNLELERLGYRDVKQKADACGLEYEVMRQMLKGKHPSDERIVEICERLKLCPEISGKLLMAKMQDRAKDAATKNVLKKVLEDIPRYDAGNVQSAPFEIVEDHKIPIYTTIKAGNGEMGIIDGESEGFITITDEYLKQKVFAVKVAGDSMVPELYDGEIAIFKPINGEPTRERDIYAVDVEGWTSWVVKFVKADPSGIVQLVSANSAYPVREIDPKQSKIALRGRLIESRRLRK